MLDNSTAWPNININSKDALSEMGETKKGEPQYRLSIVLLYGAILDDEEVSLVVIKAEF